MGRQSAALILVMGAAVATDACAAKTSDIEPKDRPLTVAPMGKDVENEQLPINQRFRTLDDYLRYLERDSHRDGKWYKEIRPGVYEVQTGNLHLDIDTQQRVFTREELEKKFGFSR